MRRCERLRRMVACGAVLVAVLAGVNVARAQGTADAAAEGAASGQESPDRGLWSAAACRRCPAPELASEQPGGHFAPTPQRSFAAADAPGDTSPKATGIASLPDAPAPQNSAYVPITGRERLGWVAEKTLGLPDLAAGVFISAIGTARNQPPEDGPHWGGFAERYGIRLTGIGTLSTMEAGLGAIWGEDPRYKPEPEKHLGGRLASVVVQTFATRRRDGHFAPAYARFMAVPGSNFLSNTWRPDSEADNYHAGIRTLEGFAGLMASNAWDEFWPTIKAHIFHKHSSK